MNEEKKNYLVVDRTVDDKHRFNVVYHLLYSVIFFLYIYKIKLKI